MALGLEVQCTSDHAEAVRLGLLRYAVGKKVPGAEGWR